MFAGQREEEPHYAIDIRPRYLAAELVAAHDLDRLRQRRRAAVVEIGSGGGDVAQRGHAEDMAVGLGTGDREASEIGLRLLPLPGERVGEDAELLEQIAAALDALLAGGAA